MRTRIAIAALSLLIAGACADEASKVGISTGDNNGRNGGFADAGRGSTNNFVPEVEEEFDFAEPAVLGTDVYVANETLNSVAVIDSRSLTIRTIPVGFKPTRVVGPADEGAADARVYVLNEGSSTVSLIDPANRSAKSVDILRRGNALKASPDGTWALAWFDDTERPQDQTAGDLSAMTLVKANGEAHQLAVGFRIERVRFTPDSSTALALSDDGVSVIDVDAITDDALAPPVAVLPPELQQFDRTDREVLLDPDGEWAIARIATRDEVVLTELATGAQWRVPLASTPTDIDWIAGDTPRVLGMLGKSDYAFVADVPDGLVALADASVGPDMGMPDMGSDMGSDMGADTGSDMGADMDAGAADMDTGGVDMDAGNTDPPDLPTMPATGFTYLALTQPGLGAAEVAPDSTSALIFSTLQGERRAILLDLATLEQRGLAFEKGVRGAVADDNGSTFVVLHTREEGAIPPGATPSDPEYVARSWGISVVDVTSAATRLVLTEQKPGVTTLWADDQVERLYMIFERPVGDAQEQDSHRDVLRVDLRSFSTSTFRVPSLPEGLGRIDEARKVFVNQIHPQGRITFVGVDEGRRQTVTGYQLNSGID